MPQRCLQEQEITTSMERLQLVSLHRCFVLVQVCEWVLGTVVMCIIISIDRLSLEPGNCVKLLDCGRTQTSECPEHGSLDLSDLSILHSIDKSVLGLRCMILQLLGSILLAERSNLVQDHVSSPWRVHPLVRDQRRAARTLPSQAVPWHLFRSAQLRGLGCCVEAAGKRAHLVRESHTAEPWYVPCKSSQLYLSQPGISIHSLSMRKHPLLDRLWQKMLTRTLRWQCAPPLLYNISEMDKQNTVDTL